MLQAVSVMKLLYLCSLSSGIPFLYQKSLSFLSIEEHEETFAHLCNKASGTDETYVSPNTYRITILTVCMQIMFYCAIVVNVTIKLYNYS